MAHFSAGSGKRQCLEAPTAWLLYRNFRKVLVSQER
jgi:hypothetical protein